MKITIVQADRTSDKEIKALADLDVRIFPHKADLFNEQDWQYFRKLFEFFWILADGVIAGSIHLGLNLEWEEDLPSISYGCLYFTSSQTFSRNRLASLLGLTLHLPHDLGRSPQLYSLFDHSTLP